MNPQPASKPPPATVPAVNEEHPTRAELRRLTRSLALLHETHQAIVQSPDTEVLFDRVCDVAVHYGEYAAAWVVLLDPQPRLVAWRGLPEALRREMGLGLELADRAAELTDPGFLLSVEPAVGAPWLASLFAAWALTWDAYTRLPLRREGEVIGCLCLAARGEGGLGEAGDGLLYGLAVDISFAIDVLSRDAKRRELEAHHLLAAQVFENSHEGIVITDAAGNIISVNRAFTETTGYTVEEVLGRNPRILSSGRQDKDFYRLMWLDIREKGRWQGEIWNRRKNGEVYAEWLGITAAKNAAGELTNYIAIFSDITEQKAARERIDFLAHHDLLTGLPNRSLVADVTRHAVGRAGRENRQIALLFVDLDRFKQINDSFGHRLGDELLLVLSQRMSGVLRDADTLGRLSGDEFLVVADNLRHGSDAAHVAQKIVDAVAEPVELNGHTISLSASVGIAVWPDDGGDFETLLRKADTAMYHAKEAGRATVRYFDAHMNDNALERLQLVSQLRRALEEEQFVLHFQPQVSLEDGRIVGAEALVRWQHPERGMVPPGLFIPVAEDSGLIVPLGEWVLRTACRQARAWLDAGLPPIVVAVNVSGIQFRRGDLLQTVTSILGETGLPAECLELEITESTMVQDDDVVLDTVRQFKRLGLQLSIDDFGTGFSNLGYLQSFEADKLKVDQSFVRGLDTGAGDKVADGVLVNTIIQMGRSLKLTTIAEGVETADQLALLRGYDCDEVQGYLFSKPLPVDEFTTLLASGRHWQV